MRGFLFNEEDNDKCPLCGLCQETNQHVVRCRHEQVIHHRINQTEKFKLGMKKIGTDPRILQIMAGTLHNETDSEILEQHKVAQDKQIFELCD